MKPDDEYLYKQWAFASFHPDSWHNPSDGHDVIVAVLDTGIDDQHEDLKDTVIASINFTDSLTAADDYGHGTHLAGIIAANTNNGIGIAGMAPYARLLNVKVVQKSGDVPPSQIAAGIIWAADRGAMIINMSFTLDRPIPSIENAIDYAWSKGALIVAAAENQPGSVHQYPACYNHCLAVTATDRNNALCHWASNGSWIDIAAPGESIYSILPNNRYGYKSGTSMAAAYVTGLAACFFTSTSDVNHNGFINDDVSSVLVSLAGSQGVMSPEMADCKMTSRLAVLSISSISKATQLITNELVTEGEGK